MPGQSQVFLLLANFELDGMTSQKRGVAAKHSFKIVASRVEVWASLELNFFRVADTLEADSLLNGKTPWLHPRDMSTTGCSTMPHVIFPVCFSHIFSD